MNFTNLTHASDGSKLVYHTPLSSRSAAITTRDVQCIEVEPDLHPNVSVLEQVLAVTWQLCCCVLIIDQAKRLSSLKDENRHLKEKIGAKSRELKLCRTR